MWGYTEEFYLHECLPVAAYCSQNIQILDNVTYLWTCLKFDLNYLMSPEYANPDVEASLIVHYN